MKNTQNKLILGIATLVAVFGMTNTVFAASPTMSTMPSSSITKTSASLNGAFNANGTTPIDVRFEYGTTPSFGSSTGYTTYTVNAGAYSDTITGLTPNTTYYFRAMGVNASSPAMGGTLSFTTLGNVSASIITTPATSITTTSATLNGAFNSNGSSTNTWFEYGTNSGLSTFSSTTPITQAGNSGSIIGSVSGLTPNTTYYFRAVANNANGTTRSTTILSFTTLAGGYTPPTPTGNKCYISSFNANSYYITRGNTVYLSWATSNCTNATLSPSGYNALSASSYAVYPSSNTNTYTLYASNGTSSDTSYITITTNNGGYNPNPNPYYPPNPPYYPPNPPYYPTGGGTTYRTYDYMPGTNGNGNTSTGVTNRIYNKVKGAFSGTNNADASSSSNTVTSNTTNSTNNSDSSSLSAAVGLSGGSFFPNTFFGWLILILIILVIAMIVRTITKRKSASAVHH